MLHKVTGLASNCREIKSQVIRVIVSFLEGRMNTLVMIACFTSFLHLNMSLSSFLSLSCCLQTHKIDPSGHYMRLKVWTDNQMLFYVPKLEEDISDLVRKHTLKHCGNNLHCMRILKFSVLFFIVLQSQLRHNVPFRFWGLHLIMN